MVKSRIDTAFRTDYEFGRANPGSFRYWLWAWLRIHLLYGCMQMRRACAEKTTARRLPADRPRGFRHMQTGASERSDVMPEQKTLTILTL
jgi:hypothetical protein